MHLQVAAAMHIVIITLQTNFTTATAWMGMKGARTVPKGALVSSYLGIVFSNYLYNSTSSNAVFCFRIALQLKSDSRVKIK